MFPFTLQQLRILKAIATEENFTRAAEVLYISQPSLSKQLKTLEKNLDITLINRGNNKIFLTEKGKIFLQYSERILALCEESCRALIDLKNGDRGNLTIGTSQTIGTYLMPQILSIFAQNYPQIDLKIKFNSTPIIINNILKRKIDIGVVGGEIPYKLRKNLLSKYFIKDEINLIISTIHPFAKKKRINKEDLYYLNFITLNSNSTIQKFIDNILIQNQIETKQLKVIMELNSIEGIKTAVSLGLGAAFMSSLAIEKELKLKTIEILTIKDIKITRSLSIISNSKYYKSKAFEFFCNELYVLKNKLKY